MGQNSLWYISSEARDKFDTVVSVVNKTDQGVFSCPSASGIAELLHTASSPPTATPQTKKGGQPGGTVSREGLRGRGQSHARGCSNLSLRADTARTQSLLSWYLQRLLISEGSV